jgi:hypothetical protein
VNPWFANFLREIAAAPQSVALEIVPIPFSTPDELLAHIPPLASKPGTGLIIGPEASITGHLNDIWHFATYCLSASDSRFSGDAEVARMQGDV